MVKLIKGSFDGSGMSVAIVLSEFNEMITGQLKKGAIDALTKAGVDEEAITVYQTPGSFELPALARKVVETGRYDGVVCLGAVIRGETPHFDYVASEVTRGIGNLNYRSEIPVVFGVITASTVDQAVDRAGVKAGNKGAEAALALVQQAAVYRNL